MGKKLHSCGWISACCGVVLVVLGCAVQWFIFPKVFETMVYDNLRLEEGTEAWNAFLEPPVPVYMKFMFYNVDNKEDILNGAKPQFTEKGPYIYREVRKKQNIFEVDIDKLQYGTYIEYHFDQGKTTEAGCKNNGTVCSDSDKIVVMDAILGGVAASVSPLLSSLPPELQPVVSIVLGVLNSVFNSDEGSPFFPYKESLFKEVSVNEFLYEGYHSPLIDSLYHIEEILILTFQDLGFGDTIEQGLAFIQTLLNGAGIDIDVKTEYDKIMAQLKEVLDNPPAQIAGRTFGLFKGKNATATDSYYLVNTGKFEKHNTMKLLEVNGKSRLPDDFWPLVAPSPSGQDSGVRGICHDIYGTDGQQFPPFVDERNAVWIYVGELCRSLWLEFQEEVEIFGVPVYRYRPAKEVFDMDYPYNYCYCPEFFECATRMEGKDEWNRTACADLCKDGMLKVGKCYGGAPIIMSPPHFLDSDPSLLEEVEGISEPDRNIHETFLDVEPITGATMGAHKRIQINLPLQSVPGFVLMSDVRDMVFPVLWADETAQLDEVNADDFIKMVLLPKKAITGISIGFGIVFGALLSLTGIFLIARNGSTRQNF